MKQRHRTILFFTACSLFCFSFYAFIYECFYEKRLTYLFLFGTVTLLITLFITRISGLYDKDQS
jgi:hypothetical protein